MTANVSIQGLIEGYRVVGGSWTIFHLLRRKRSKFISIMIIKSKNMEGYIYYGEGLPSLGTNVHFLNIHLDIRLFTSYDSMPD